MSKPGLGETSLDSILIASPCNVPWDAMTGDDRRRYCGRCRLHVYDLSRMTRKEAVSLLDRTDGQVCKRVWRRADGTVISRDGRSVLDAISRRVRLLAGAFAGLLALVGLGGCGGKRPANAESGGASNGAPPVVTASPSAGADPAEAPTKPPEPGAQVTTGR